MKRVIALLLVLCLLMAGCANSQGESGEISLPVAEDVVEQIAEEVVEAPAQTQAGKTILPLPDTTMENLTDAILHVSLGKGDAYVDDKGILQMDVTIYTYDKYDMVDMAMLEVGDVIIGYAGEVEVTSVERNEAGTVMINGGLEAGGFDLVTDDEGVFYELGFSDAKNWYEVGTATLRVSTEMVGIDNANPERGEVTFYPGDLLTDAIENFHFTPHNTTVRMEGGQIVEMNRRYVP